MRKSTILGEYRKLLFVGKEDVCKYFSRQNLEKCVTNICLLPKLLLSV